MRGCGGEGGMCGCWGYVWLLGVCVVAGGVHGYQVGCAWLLGCVCVVAGGHAWLPGGPWLLGGVHGCRGACMVVWGGMHGI